MGQAAEDLEDLEYKQSLPRSEINPHGYKVVPKWTMANGKKVAINKMETSHIENCIRMLQRAIIDPYQYGEPDGEAANDAFQQGVRQIEERNTALNHNIKIFNEELKRRAAT